MCIKWPWSTAHCIKWEPHMEPCKHVSAWEDCCDHRGRVFISPRKLNCQGWSYSMAINCWPWGPDCMHFFFGCIIFLKLLGLSVLGGSCMFCSVNLLPLPTVLELAWDFLCFHCVPDPKHNQLVTLAWVQSSTGVSSLTDRRTAFHIPLLYRNWAGGPHSWITQALLKNSQSGQRSDMNINDQNTLFLSVYKGSCEKGSDWNTCFWPACLRVLFTEWWEGGPRRGQSHLRPWSHLSSISETTCESCSGSLGELLHLHFLEPQFL